MTQANHQHLNTSFQTATDISNNRPYTKFSIRKMMIIALSFIIILAAGWTYYQAVKEHGSLTATYQLAKAENQQAVVKNSKVYQEYQNLQDPEYLAQVARRDYYYAKNGEIIFVLPDDANDANVFEQDKN